MGLTIKVTPDVRYFFTAQFLRGAALFAKRAREIENVASQPAAEEVRSEHNAYVIASIMQSVAALEAAISEVIFHGPGFHLGSNGTDDIARDFLHPLTGMIDDQKTIRRYELVLHLLGKPSLDKEGQIYESADLLVKLRNELVHYKSKGGQEMKRQTLFKRLKDLRLEKPSFVEPNTNFFPHQLLGASCASWAVITAKDFINTFYGLLGVPNPLEVHKEGLAVPPIRYRKGTAS